MRRPLIAFVVLLAACTRHAPERPIAASARDIILITLDTTRADSLGFAGNSAVKTPFLDALAGRGVVFANAHAHNVITLPSHVNILTGLYPFQHGVRENAGFKLDPKFPTVAAMLHDSGYATGAFIGAFPLDRRFGLDRGFDLYDDNYGKGEASVDFVEQERRASAVLSSATKWWRDNEGKKRFMWVHLYDAHAPYSPPEPFYSQYRANEYLGEIAYVDSQLQEQLGPILAADPGALVVVTADHGEALGDHGEQTHGLFAYESTLKIPLVVAGAGVPHRVEKAYVRHIDIVPTILQAAGAKAPAPLPGASLLEPSGTARDSYFEALSASLNRGWAPLTGIIHSEEKYIELPIAELYDLPRDPGEKNNLRQERRRDAETSRRLLASLGASTTAPNRNVSAEEEAQLRSLGYVGGAGSTKTTFTAADDPKNLIDLDSKMHGVIDAYEHHDAARALALARQVVAARPDMAAGRQLLAFVLQQTEHVGEAIENFRAALESVPQDETIRVQLGLLLTESGKTDEAVQILAPLAKGNNPDALNAYGIALADQGKFDQAEALFRRTLELDANNAPALQDLGIVALRRDDVAGAQGHLERALALNPRLPLALNTLGVVYARQNDFGRAVEMWNRAVAIDPRQYDALYNIGLVEARAGHVAEARRALQRFVETAPPARYAKDIETSRQALAALR